MTPPPPVGHTDAEQVRVVARRARRAIGGSRRRAAETAARANLVEVVEPLPPGRIALSLPTDGELDVAAAADRLRHLGWTTYLPRVRADRSMEFGRWDVDTELRRNRYGIAEPVADPAGTVGVEDLDVVVVPCVALDVEGHRVGFGVGFYDRALAGRRPTCVVIGAGFEEQLVERLEPASWDVPMDVVVTERRVVRRPGGALATPDA